MVSPSADDDAQTDLQALFAATPGFAATQLESGGAFHPYAAHLGTDDRISLLAADADLLAENPDSLSIIQSLTETLGMGVDELRATAVVSNSDAGDAILVHLEHRHGISVRVAIPYTRDGSSVTVHEPGGVEPTPAVVFA